ncbi:MAG TPA: SEC-C metal-binding domain-containing protein [Xanthobacteraceae bacterium]|nr:SEC-C metal-binding domain-containing protein [Xanthobacteraceae bacterium]
MLRSRRCRDVASVGTGEPPARSALHTEARRSCRPGAHATACLRFEQHDRGPRGRIGRCSQWRRPCASIAIFTTSPAFSITRKRRKSFPSETQVGRGVRVVHGDVELVEKLGRNDLCPCGSGSRFQAVLPAIGPP